MSIWVLCEGAGGKFRSSTYELLSEARKLAGADTAALVVGDDAALKDDLDGLAGKVVVLTGDNLSPYTSDSWLAAVAPVLADAKAELVLFGEGQRTRDLLPALAAKLEASAVTNAIGLAKDGGSFVIHRPVQGGKAYADIAITGLCLAAFRPNSFLPDAPADLSTSVEEVAASAPAARVELVDSVVEEGRRIDITEAQVVACGGRGMKAAENLRLLDELGSMLGGTYGVTRAIVDAGWEGADHSIQVGKSGKTISPALYFGCGISGIIHHTMGMDTSKVIVAVNTDPEAAIFEYADYGIVGDALEILPIVIEQIKQLKASA
jgi:electron transfer flavoprotein alpha subunit